MNEADAADGDSDEPKLAAYMGLPVRLRRFVDHYIACGKGAESIRRMGYQLKRPDDAAYKLLQKPGVRAALREREAEAIQRAASDHWSTWRQINAIAELDHRDLFDEVGNLRPLHELPREVVGAIASIEVEELFAGRGEERVQIGRLKKIKTWSKIDALKLKAQLQKLITDRHEHSGPDGAPLQPPVINFGFENGGPGD